MQKDNSHSAWSRHPDDLELRSHQVDIWRVSLDLQPDSVKSLESSLSEDEIQRSARFHFDTDRQRFIVAHGCLRGILARYLRCESRQLEFSVDGYGKPSLPGHEIEFNLSHSGSYALVAVSRQHRLGVDLELIRNDVEIESLATRFFSPTEVTELMALPLEQRPLGFFNCWTRKEAYIKAQGLGLSLPLDSFDVSLSPNTPAILRATRPNQYEALQWTLLSFDVEAGYVGAAAVHGQGSVFRFWDGNGFYKW